MIADVAFVVSSAALCNGPLNFSYTAIPRPSTADPSSVILPFRLSCMTSAISSAAPEQSRSFSSYSAVVSTPVFKIMFRPLILSDVKVESNAACFSASPMPFVAFSTSLRTSVISRKLPLLSMTLTFASPIAIEPSSIFEVISRIMAATAVPASAPRRPLFASISRKEVVVSISCPAEFMLAAQFLYD